MNLNSYELAAEVLDRGGFTVDQHQAHPVRGFAVGTRPEATVSFHPGTDSLAEGRIAEAIAIFARRQAAELREGYYLGAWTDDGIVVLDLVQVFESRVAALLAADRTNQTAIYDLATETTILVSEALREQRERALDDAGSDWAYPYESAEAER